jgi:hypothetical protein
VLQQLVAGFIGSLARLFHASMMTNPSVFRFVNLL